MTMKKERPVDAGKSQPRVFGFSLSFFTNRNLRRVLNSAGVKVRLGWPRSDDRVLIWGRAKTASRGLAVSSRSGASVLTAEDGFLRSVSTGRSGGLPLSVVLDAAGIYFDTSQPNDLQNILLEQGSLTPEEVEAADDALAFVQEQHLSKYNDFAIEPLDGLDDYVLVVDQTFNDASVSGAGANAETFKTMLQAALDENPGKHILVKTHPETIAGHRRGYFGASDGSDRVTFLSDAISPWLLFSKANSVYCVSSTMGMEAIFAGLRPKVFGNAFYCGLGLTDDRHETVVSKPNRTRQELFHAVYMKYSHWFDPYTQQSSDVMGVARTLAALASFQRKHGAGQVFVGMRLWKRGFLRRFFKTSVRAPMFVENVDKAVQTAVSNTADILVWSGKETEALAQSCAQNQITLYRVEDGFLRSVGLGAALIEPVSLALDDLGIYYDPNRESRLERLISDRATMPPHGVKRAQAVLDKVVELGLSKYNLAASITDLPQERHVVLVPGQVEDDQSILKGAGQIATNLDLVKATKEAFPESYLVYKPHPDVLAGLRDGGDAEEAISKIVDAVVPNADIARLLQQVDCVSTITSLTGFEALIRGKDVVCFGAPFYAGWGLTDDRGTVPDRRKVKVSLEGLVHAALIDYPVYWDPVTGHPCPIETVLSRFEAGQIRQNGRVGMRWLAKLQGLFASYAYLWR